MWYFVHGWETSISCIMDKRMIFKFKCFSWLQTFIPEQQEGPCQCLHTSCHHRNLKCLAPSPIRTAKHFSRCFLWRLGMFQVFNWKHKIVPGTFWHVPGTPGRGRRPISSGTVKSQWNALRQGSCRSWLTLRQIPLRTLMSKNSFFLVS